MGRFEASVRGELGKHPLARRFAAEVVRIHTRYADEVVARFRLCPYLRDAETGFGQFVVMLDREPSVEGTLAAVKEAEAPVVHLVFPCVRTPPSPWERFAARFGEALRRSYAPGNGAGELQGVPVSSSKALVLAAFHPEMSGDVSSSHRMVGLLRRAPDPFVQLIPPGLSQGGTVLAGSGVAPGEDAAEATFARLRAAGFAEVQAKLTEVHADRDASYAPFLDALGLSRPGARFDAG
ncbi:MAG: hypothetical protein IT372_20165 [Polyangiaceae bacterium]|nr:hypothetical protein [Polyangiaceae bacterium]